MTEYDAAKHLTWLVDVIKTHGEAAGYAYHSCAEEINQLAQDAGLDAPILEAVDRICFTAVKWGGSDGFFDARYCEVGDLAWAREVFASGTLPFIFPQNREAIASAINADSSIGGYTRFWLLYACRALPFVTKWLRE